MKNTLKRYTITLVLCETIIPDAINMVIERNQTHESSTDDLGQLAMEVDHLREITADTELDTVYFVINDNQKNIQYNLTKRVYNRIKDEKGKKQKKTTVQH